VSVPAIASAVFAISINHSLVSLALAVRFTFTDPLNITSLSLPSSTVPSSDSPFISTVGDSQVGATLAPLALRNCPANHKARGVSSQAALI